MSITLQLPAEMERCLRERAAECGSTLEDFLHDVLAQEVGMNGMTFDERTRQCMLEELRRKIAVGIEQADRGELAPFDPRATLARIRQQRATQANEGQ